MAKEKEFVWFGPESTAALRNLLNESGEGSHIELHGKDERTTIYVMRAGEGGELAEGGGGINEAHICPPVCP
jgi:hypothetical protein